MNDPIVARLVPIKYFTPSDIYYQTKPNNDQLINITDSATIKTTIGNLLFEELYDNVLVNWNGSMYLCEITDREKREYSPRKINYHPKATLFVN